MTDEVIKNIFPQVKLKESLAGYTTFRMGGVASWLVLIESSEELVEAIKKLQAHKIPYYVFAGGSNIIFTETLLNKVVFVCYKTPKLNKLNAVVCGPKIEVEAGVALQPLIDLSLNNNLAGLESLSGIPGTIGGAVAGNAGAYGQSISDTLEKVQIFDGQKVRWLLKQDCFFAYRTSIFKQKKWLILKAVFVLKLGDGPSLTKKSQDIIEVRNKKYTPGLKCPGSFFKNVLVKNVSKEVLKNIPADKIIEGKIPAGFLLEQVGAKGSCVGQIYIPDFHGNLLINKGSGKTTDVIKLADKLKAKVKTKFGIILEEEVQIV